MEGNYTQSTIKAPVAVPGSTNGAAMVPFDYKTFEIFYRPIFREGIIEEPMYQMDITSANSFFTGNQIVKPEGMTNNLDLGQEIFAIVEKIQNPFDLFVKEVMTYTDIDDQCLSMLDLNCQMACLNTLPSFERMRFRFDTEYTWGVVACDKNKKFWDMAYFTKQFNKSIAAKNFGQEVDLWNKVVKSLIATPATTVDVQIAEKQPTHYWQNLGSVAAKARDYIQGAAMYLINNVAGIDPKIIMTPEAARDIIRSVETPWGLNNNTQRVNTNFDYDQPGYMIDEQVRDLIGTMVTVLIMRRSPWLSYTGTGNAIVSQYPLWNANGTKQYVFIGDPRVGFQFKVPGYTLNIQPYDCDHLQRGIQESEYVGSGITFPIYGMILEFDASPAIVPENGAVAATNEVIKTLVGGAEPAEPVAPAV